MTDLTTDATTLVDTYLAAWNERDPQRRAELIQRAWAPGGRLVDPPPRPGPENVDCRRFRGPRSASRGPDRREHGGINRLASGA